MPPMNGGNMAVTSDPARARFMRAAQIEADEGGACVRDCHAEVLVRPEGFKPRAL